MHSRVMLSKFLQDVCPLMHAKRRESLEAVICSCLRQEKISVTALGRGISTSVLEKHRIKQADRLLSNQHLHNELFSIYKHLADLATKGLERVIILVDWSNLDQNERHFLIRASVAVEGRAITIYEEVHTKETKEKLKTHKQFLKNLKTLLPEEVTPILVADAGFRITWFKEVQKYGWEWVGRIRGRMKVKLTEDCSWKDGRLLHPEATVHAKDFGVSQIGKQNNLSCRLVLYKGEPKGRVLQDKLGRRKKGIRAKRAERANQEPWLLATSMKDEQHSAMQIVEMYRCRMQIEESFRDMKCRQYGIGLKESRTYKTQRMKVLVAIASLVSTFAWILGKAVTTVGAHRHFQANTTNTKPVLSHVFLGIKFFKQKRIKILYQDFCGAIWQLRNIAYKLCIT